MSKSRIAQSRPSHHANDAGTAFKNPWPSASAPTWTELAQYSFPFGWYDGTLHSHDKARVVKVVDPDWGESGLKQKAVPRSKCIIGTWLGHAGGIVEFPRLSTTTDGAKEPSLWFLFDPIFSMRAGPTQYTGPTRMKKSPCQVADLPGCDAVFISHNHYDHLDLSTIRAILIRFPNARYFVPLRNKGWLTSTGVLKENISELDWWQSRELCLQDFGQGESPQVSMDTIYRFSCVPAQHNSGRSGIDQGTTLWCGWVVERYLTSKDESSTTNTSRRGIVYHAGDTGYKKTARSHITCPAFKEIAAKFAPIDLSFIPIWRGGTLGFISSAGLRLSHQDIPSALHGSPTDAVAIHLDVQSRNTIGVHFGTFIGSENESLEATIEFGGACDASGVKSLDDAEADDKGRAGTVDIGASLVVEIA